MWTRSVRSSSLLLALGHLPSRSPCDPLRPALHVPPSPGWSEGIQRRVEGNGWRMEQFFS